MRVRGDPLGGNVHARLRHYGDGSWILAVRLDAGGLHNDGVTADMPRPTFGNLGAAGIAGTNKNNFFLIFHINKITLMSQIIEQK